ncbi:MAG: hypothetical protein E7317_02170 [Clostridiales bacterium]|nr:hypothetical protein [Clostridiales bacterium]
MTDIIETIIRARAAIPSTPLAFDCGSRCGAACCSADEDGQGGVWLLPGEDALLEDVSWGHVVPAPTAPMLMCDGPCDRDARPLLCRIFPLTPFVRKDGSIGVRTDARAAAVCPLARGGKRAMLPAFVRDVEEVVRILMREETTRAVLEEWMRLEREYRRQARAFDALFR